ncbi:MAG: globin domain-containing protein [Hyphomonadaceae bacterium]
MDQRQIDLVRQSFARAEKIAPHVAATFYAELFAIDPTLRPLFKGDMVALGRKLMEMLGRVVEALDAPETILPEVQALALRHVTYGVEPHHYTTASIALLRTLRHELSADFTPEIRAAWSAAYQMLSDTMREAAYGPAASRAP